MFTSNYGSYVFATAVLAVLVAGAVSAIAQQSPPEDPEYDSSKDPSTFVEPPDRFNRGTPRGSAYGFIAACRDFDYERAARFMDLKGLAPEDRKRGPELSRQFKEVLDQKLWLDFSTLSNTADGFTDDGLPAWQDRLGEIQTRKGLVTLLLQRVPRAGDGVRVWKISSSTVDKIGDLYDEFGPGRLEAWLPPIFFSVHFMDLALWQWLGLLILGIIPGLMSGLFSGFLVRVLGKLFTRKGKKVDDRIVDLVRGPVRLALTVLVFNYGRRYLALDIPVQEFLRVMTRLLWAVVTAWLAFRLIDFGVLALRDRAIKRRELGQIPSLIPLKRFAQALVVALGVLGVLSALGVNITAALAGLGIGGIAVALGAQKTFENLFGSIALIVDEPVRVGDFFRHGDKLGTVEEIGLRSTRVRTLNRTVITIPNSKFSELALENFAKRDRIWFTTVIKVRYETTPDQLRFLLARLREILLAHPRVVGDSSRVRLVNFESYSLDLEVFAYLTTTNWAEFLEIREDIFLRFMDAVREAGTTLAFPSSRTYLGRDEGLDPDEVRRAEARVAEWREKGDLPFPDFSREARDLLRDSIEWPPPGSPGGPSANRKD